LIDPVAIVAPATVVDVEAELQKIRSAGYVEGSEARVKIGRALLRARKLWPERGPKAKGWGEFLESVGLPQPTAWTYMELARQRASGCSSGPRVYFVAGARSVKIGHSVFPEARLQQLQTGSPVALRLLGTVPGGVAEERALHERFASLRTHGEWFRCEGDLANFLRETFPESAR
jgi:hypothetical protein